ncbi:bZIP transcription factor 1-A-like [Drosophila elegans]|uniref:bZIP transcription factor 1-A-like n=1 Tax=Drosophila elegans TaxID=30023 RepID=UPI0007E7738B|nr:bZIP transcription factor 1-A-like [Drosophila elegans]
MWKWKHIIILVFIVPASQGLENKTSTLASKQPKEVPNLERFSTTKAISIQNKGVTQLASKLPKEVPDLERNSTTKAKSVHDNGLRFRAPPILKYVYYPYLYPMQPYPQYPPHGYYPPQAYFPPNGYYPPTGKYPPNGFHPIPYPYPGYLGWKPPDSSWGGSAPENVNILDAKHKVRSPVRLPEPPVAPVAPSPGFGAQNQNVITIVIGKDPK